MSGALLRLWLAVGRHRMLAGWLAAAVAIALFSGGVAYGSTRARAVPPGDIGPTPPALARARAASLEAVVLARRPNGVLMRTRGGDVLTVRLSPETVVRRDGKSVSPATLRRGTRVLVLGRPGDQPGSYQARVIAVVGQAPEPRPPFDGAVAR